MRNIIAGYPLHDPGPAREIKKNFVDKSVDIWGFWAVHKRGTGVPIAGCGERSLLTTAYNASSVIPQNGGTHKNTEKANIYKKYKKGP